MVSTIGGTAIIQPTRFLRLSLLGVLTQSPTNAFSQLIIPTESHLRHVQIGVGVTGIGMCTGEGFALEQSDDLEPFAVSLNVSRACEYGQATGSASQISRIDEDSIFMRATLSGRFSTFQSTGHSQDVLGRSLWNVQFSISRRALFRLRAGAAATIHLLADQIPPTGRIYSRATLLLGDEAVIRVDSQVRSPGSEREDRTELVWLDPGTYTLSALCHSEVIGSYPEPMGSQEYAAWLAFTLEHLPCPGDIDGDQDVDVLDLSTLLANFNDEPIYPYGEGGDIDGDEFVTMEDLSLLLANFGAMCSEAP